MQTQKSTELSFAQIEIFFWTRNISYIMKIPAVKLILPDEVIEQVSKVLASGNWIDGKMVKKLEKEWADYCGVKYCRAVSSGTSGLLSVLSSLDLKAGDEVIVPSFSFIATANSVLFTEAKPVFADIDPTTFNLNPDSVLEKITKKTKAIMPVHLFGLCAEMDRLHEICEDMDLFLIEDACQAHGAEYRSEKAGSLGLAGVFSLYPTKNMYCGGEGGLITTNDEDFYEKICEFMNHGQKAKYQHESLGYNFRLQETNAVVARYALENLDAWNAQRQENAAFYNKSFQDIEGISNPIAPEYCKHVYHQYTIQVDNRDTLVGKFQENNIGFGIHYNTPIHLQPYYQSLNYQDKLPVTEECAEKVISLPNHPFMIEEEKEEVASVVQSAFE